MIIRQDGKIIYICHGRCYTRVSANHIIKGSQEFANTNLEPVITNKSVNTYLKQEDSASDNEKNKNVNVWNEDSSNSNRAIFLNLL